MSTDDTKPSSYTDDIDDIDKIKNDDLLPVKKSEKEIFDNVKANIIKMFVNRKFIDIENQDERIEKILNDENDENEYIVKLDHDKNYNTHIPNKKIHIKFIFEKINSLNKSSPLVQFIENVPDQYKFIVVLDIQTRTKTTIDREIDSNLIEIYNFKDLKENKVDNVYVSKYEILSEEESVEFLNSYRLKKSNIPLLYSCDMMAKYYKLKGGQIVRTVKPSIATCFTPYYRFVVYRSELVIKT